MDKKKASSRLNYAMPEKRRIGHFLPWPKNLYFTNAVVFAVLCDGRKPPLSLEGTLQNHKLEQMQFSSEIREDVVSSLFGSLVFKFERTRKKNRQWESGLKKYLFGFSLYLFLLGRLDSFILWKNE